MNIQQRVSLLEEDIIDLRKQWVKASTAMKMVLEQKAKEKRGEIKIFESVLRRRGLLTPKVEQEKQPKLI